MVFEHFKLMVLYANQSLTPIVSLTFHVVSLSLYIPLHVLEIFAGKDGEESSAKVRRDFIDHISPQHLRQASWHAGQLLRISKSMSPGSLVGFGATCLHFAALTLWTYGAVINKSRQGTPEWSNTSGVILLDQDVDPRALDQFIVYGQGTPALSAADTPIDPHNGAAVMRVFLHVLQLNHPSGTLPVQLGGLCDTFKALGNFTMPPDC